RCDSHPFPTRRSSDLRLDCERGGQPFSVAVAVSERDDDTARLTALVDPRRHVVPRLGILGLTLDAPLAHLLRVSRARAGVVENRAEEHTSELQSRENL